MAEFHEIGSSQFHEKATPTGLEKIQVSATEYVTLQAIANLYKEKEKGGFSEVVIASASPKRYILDSEYYRKYPGFTGESYGW